MRSQRLAALFSLVSLISQASASDPGVAPLQISAKSAIIVDEKSGCVLYAKDADSKRFPASTTKILTTLLLLERTLPTDRIVAPADIEQIPESSAHLKPGETMTAQDMAYALMLRSANDACCAVALHISGSLSSFADLMNQRAKDLGCTNTNFVSPNGLHDDKHYTTARDLSIIARAAMKNPTFRKLADTYKHQLSRSINQEDLWMVSKNKFLAWDPTHDGIKTGYTKPAGHCFVGSATRNGFRVITVILAAEDWKADEKAMIDWAFKNYERQVIAQRNAKVAQATVKNGSKAELSVKVGEPVYYAVKKGGKPDIQQELKVPEDLSAPIKEGDKIGKIVFKDASGWAIETPVFAAESVDKQATILGARMNFPFILIVGALVGGTILIKKKQRKYYKSVRSRGRRA